MKELSTQQLRELVSAYQMGDEQAAEIIIEAYESYFQKFISLVKYGKGTLYDKTTRQFIFQFFPDHEQEGLKKWAKSKYVQKRVSEKIESIQAQAYFLEENELRSEMMIIFLTILKRFEGKSIRAYISKYFPIMLSGRLVRLFKKQAEYDYHRVPYTENISEIGYTDEYDWMEDKPGYYIIASEPTFFDENWINGVDCGEPFNHLTPHERRILKLYYEWKTIGRIIRTTDMKRGIREMDNDTYHEMKSRLKKTEWELAEILGCSRKTVNEKRNMIKQKVKEMATDLRLIKG